MPDDTPKKIFISYARVDGVELAERLKTDLTGRGHIPWLDTERIAGGASWTAAIESALDESDVVLALLSQGSYVSPRSALLFTTRDASTASALGALDHPAGSLTREESRAVLARWAALDPAHLPGEAEELVAECGRLPLALAMVGAMLRGKPAALWKRHLGFLRSADLEKIKAQFPDYPYPNLFRAIQVSVDELDATTRERYLALAVLLDSMPAHPVVQQTLWQTSEDEAIETAERLIELSLAQREADGLSIQLHGLQLDYIRSLFPDKDALALIHGAVRLARHVLARDPAQFASQMAGRLIAYEEDAAIQAFTNRFRQSPIRAWLRPITRSLTPPGGPLLLQFAGAARAERPGDPDGLSTLAVTSSQIISAAFVGTDLTTWDLETGTSLRTLTGHSGRIVALVTTPDGQRAISASLDQTIRIWDLRSGRTVRSVDGDARALAVTSDGRRLVAGSPTGAVTLFDLDNGNVVRTLDGCDSHVSDIAVADDRYVLACAGGRTFIWDLHGDPSPRVFPDGATSTTSSTSPEAVAVLTGSGRVASMSGKTLTIWDLKTGATLHTMTREGFGYDQIASLPDGRSLIYAGLMDVLEVVDAATGDVRVKLPNIAMRVANLAVTPDGRRAVTAVNSGEIRVWDLHGRAAPTVALRHSRPVRAVFVTDDTGYAVSISLDGALMWELESGNVAEMFDADWSLNPFRDSYVSSIPGPWNRVESLLPNGRAIAVVSGTTLQIRNVETGAVEGDDFGEHDEIIEVLRTTPDGRRAVTGANDGIGRIWDLEKRTQVASLERHESSIVDLALSQEARRVVSSSMDHALKVWDLDTGRLRHTLDGHTGAIGAVVQVPGRNSVVSVSHDQTLAVWNAEQGELLATFTAESMLMCCAAAPDGVTMVAGDASGGVHILRLEGTEEGASPPDPFWSVEPNRPDMGAGALARALQHQSNGEYKQAEELFQLALQTRMFLHGPKHPLIAQSLNYFGLLYCEQQRYQEAEPLFQAGLAIYQFTQGTESINVAVNLMNIGLLNAYQGKWTEAEPCYTRSISILEQQPDVLPLVLASVLEHLAEALRRTGREADAQQHEERANAIRKAHPE